MTDATNISETKNKMLPSFRHLGAYPYQVSIRQKQGKGGPTDPCSDAKHWCGGTIIDETTIITAAHCETMPPRFFCIVAGE